MKCFEIVCFQKYMSSFVVDKPRNIFWSSMCEESEGILRCSMKRTRCLFMLSLLISSILQQSQLIAFLSSSKTWLIWQKRFIISVLFRHSFNGTSFMEYRIFINHCLTFLNHCLTFLRKAFHFCKKSSTVVKDHTSVFHIFSC